MSSRLKLFLLVVIPVLAISFMYLRGLIRRAFFEPAEPTSAAARTALSQAALQETGTEQRVTLYFPSAADGKLHAESRALTFAPNDLDRIRQIVLALISGSQRGGERPLSPSAGVRAVFLTADGTAYLDFSNTALAGFTPGIESETLAVYSIVDSLAANIAAVRRVKILVQGQEVDTLDGHIDLTSDFVPDVTRVAAEAP